MNKWAADLQDTILSNSALVEGLPEDQARQLQEWGLHLAEQIGEQTASLEAEQATAFYEARSDALLKMMTRINWVATYRQKKGAGWTTSTLQKLNELNQTLHPEDAPQLSEAQISTYASQEDDLSPGELVLDLIEALSPLQLEAHTDDMLSIAEKQQQAFDVARQLKNDDDKETD